MELHYQSYGQGFPLIILHGLFGMLDNWHTVGKMLGEHFHVFTIDQRNHGRSPHSAEFNFEVMSDDIREFITTHGIAPSYVLGHSMGGKTAMWTALRYPDLVKRLVVVDIAPRPYPSHHDEILEALGSIDLKSYSSRQEIDRALSVDISEPAIRQFLMKNLARNDDGSFCWKLNLPIIRLHYREILKGIETNTTFPGPTLFVRSSKSSYIRDDDLPGIKKLFPSLTVIESPTGHWVHAEAPEQLNKAVTEFLLQE